MPHILIVEDEASTCWALAEGLSDDGYVVDTFTRAEEALEWLERSGCDLLITDLMLPGMSGIELARRMRRRRSGPPVIVVTAYGTPDTLRELEHVGVAECLPKPFAFERLRRSVQRALEHRDTRRAAPRRGRS